jgi:hypothetical protein
LPAGLRQHAGLTAGACLQALLAWPGSQRLQPLPALPASF